MKAVFVLYFLSLCAYLLAFRIFGDVYKFWKLSTYMALPLSFVPAALLLGSLRGFFAGPGPFRLASVLFLALALWGGWGVFGPSGTKAFGGRIPLFPLFAALHDAHELDNDKKRIIYDFNHPNSNFAAAVLASGEPQEKVVAGGTYFFQRNDDYLDKLEPGAVYYSDR